MLIFLLILGIVMVCLSVTLAVIETSNTNIIGGSDWPTLYFIFRHKHRGLYTNLTSFGLLSIVISIILGVSRQKK